MGLTKVNAQDIDHIRVHPLKWPSTIVPYFQQVVDLALSQTKEQYGAYRLDMYTEGITNKRAVLKLTPGNLVYIDFSTHSDFIEDGIYTNQYVFPVLNYILGLRRLIIRKSDKKFFYTITSDNTFARLKAGQPFNWPDIAIYQHAKLEVVIASDYKNLFPMLMAKRFDYIPLSLLETYRAYRQQKRHFPNISVDGNNYIFYPISVKMNISHNTPRVQERILLGMRIINENGMMQSLFENYFEEHIKSIEANDAKVFILQNPTMSAQQNHTAINNALDIYFNGQAQVFSIPAEDSVKQ